jgi:hypothetical protein
MASRSSSLAILLLSLLTANMAFSQPMPGMGPGGPGQGMGRPGGRPEIKFNYESDKDLFASEEEANAYNKRLSDLKEKDPDAYKNLQSQLMEKMRSSMKQDGPPSREKMDEMKSLMQKELKAELDKVVEEKPKVVVEEKAEEKKEEAKEEVTAKVEEPEVAVVPEIKPVAEIAAKSAEEKPALTEATAPVKAPKEKSPRGSNRNYKPSTCEWVQDIPRKIIQAPGCSREGTRICTGYVVCEQKVGGGKFTRMSTCSESLCGDNSAAACTKEKGYDSWKPNLSQAETVSRKVEAILNSASKQ